MPKMKVQFLCNNFGENHINLRAMNRDIICQLLWKSGEMEKIRSNY